MRRDPARQCASKSGGTNEPAYRHTGHRARMSRPRTVIRSAAPGPAPMKCTVMAGFLLRRARRSPGRRRSWAQAILNLVLRSEEHTSELQSHLNLVCRLLLEKKKK